MSLLSVRSFTHIFIFDTPTTREISRLTKETVEVLYPDSEVHIRDTSLSEPTNYREIFSGIKNHSRLIFENYKSANFFISVASGTPQMHACWVLLAASGEIPAKILHVRPPRFVTKHLPLVSEVDLSSDEFPSVRFKSSSVCNEEDQVDVDSVREQLGIIGDHPAMLKALDTGAMLATSPAPILITGETGTGKELFARYVHALSDRERGVFVTVNCAAIPEGLVESILFGHKKGAFTGAIEDRVGKFESANRGTLFLDELGELPLLTQAKLLRVLQENIVEPVGEVKGRSIDVRIVAATNVGLRKRVKNGKMREDLFYRLNVGEIKIPSLRDRRTDIPKLALHILDRLNESIKRPRRFTAEALNRLQAHSWEGNIRDLENVIERSVRLSRVDVLDASDLLVTEPINNADPLGALPEPYDGFSMEGFLSSARKKMILKALETANGNQSQAARMLGVTPQAIYKFLKKSK